MKTFGIAAGILTAIGILSWIVVQTLKTDRSDSAYNMHPSNFEKPDLEHPMEPDAKERTDQSDSDLNDLLQNPENDLTD